jgi:hypothetical protein
LSIIDAKVIYKNFTRRDEEIGIENPKREKNLGKEATC